MSIQNVSIDNLVYLDSGFISSKYEEINSIYPDTEFTKIEGGKAGISAPFISAGVHTQETKKFKTSSLKMLRELLPSLRDYQEFEGINSIKDSASKIGWVKGRFSIAEWRDSKTKELDGFKYFYIGEETDEQVALISQKEYFMSGIEQFVDLPLALQIGVELPMVQALVRCYYLGGHVNKTFVATPLVIYED